MRELIPPAFLRKQEGGISSALQLMFIIHSISCGLTYEKGVPLTDILALKRLIFILILKYLLSTKIVYHIP